MRCTYCDLPAVDEARARQAIDAVAPMRITREVARNKIRDFLRGQIWAPTAVRKIAVAGRSLRGLLIPTYVYDGVVRSEYVARIGIQWTRTETYTDSEGKTHTRTVVETEWFTLSGSAARQVSDHLVSATPTVEEAAHNALEPFDLGWARPFDPRLVAGFDAEVPTLPRDQAGQTAVDEVQRAEEVRIERSFLPGDRKDVTSLRSTLSIDRVRVVLLPVWTATFEHAGQTHHLYVNGQTGTVAGVVPRCRSAR